MKWIILIQMLCNSVEWLIMTEYVELDKHVQRGPIEFFLRGADEVCLYINNRKLEIKLKIILENGNDVHGIDSVGPQMISSALFMSLEMELEGCSWPTRTQNIHIEFSKI